MLVNVRCLTHAARLPNENRSPFESAGTAVANEPGVSRYFHGFLKSLLALTRGPSKAMLNLPFAPPHAARLHSDDPDQVTSWAAHRDGPHSRVVHGSGRYGFRVATVEGTSLWLGWGHVALGNTVRASAIRPFIQVPLDQPQHYAFGRRRMTVRPGEMVFVAPGTEMSRRSGPAALFAMDVDASALAAELRVRRPDAEDWPQGPQTLELPEAEQRAFGDSLRDLLRAVAPGAPPIQRVHCEGRVISLLAGALARSGRALKAGQVAARRLAGLEDWIDAHLGEAITIARLCQLTGVCERSLQLAFERRRGMSPMRFVFERRLTAAYRRLSDVTSCGSVTSIATDLGFTHLGRFSTAYREAFGETPLRTRQRARRPCRLPLV